LFQGAELVYVGTVGAPSQIALDNIRRYKSRVEHVTIPTDLDSATANKMAFLAEVKSHAVTVNVEWVIVADMDDYVTTRKVRDLVTALS
jgi:hypothetical protein